MAPKFAIGPVGTGDKPGRRQVIKSTGGMSMTPFAKKAPAGRAITGSRSAVNKDSVKGVSQTPRSRFKPTGSAKKRAAIRAMPNPTYDNGMRGN